MANSKQKFLNTRTLTQLSLLLAIEIIIGVTPLGSIPIGPIVATIAHIPVIIAAVILGVNGGLFMGFSFGLISFLVWTFSPPSPITAFVFTPAFEPGNFYSLLNCFIPRIVLGLSVALFIKLFSKFDKKGFVSIPLASVLGTFIHTVLVLGGIYLFFGHEYANAFKMEYSALLGAIGTIIATNGVVEAILAAIFALAFAKALPALSKYIRKK